MLEFIDLFAGIGGLRLGLERTCGSIGLDSKCVLSSEIDKRACETYRLNFSESPEGDIREIRDVPRFDFLLAGFPCQPFSHAGKHRGFEDTRGTLFHEIARILKKNHPRAFLLENVRGLVSNDKGNTFRTILEVLEGLGYGVKWVVLNSCRFGVPQNRVRVYIVGLLGATPTLRIQDDLGPPDSHEFKKRQPTLFDDESDSVRVADILERRVSTEYHCSDDFVRKLSRVVGTDFRKLHGTRLIDYRGGNSIHSWELGIKGVCTKREIEFMNLLIQNRRKKVFGKHQDGKKLTLDQIRHFYKNDDIVEVIDSLTSKGYLKAYGDKYDPVCGNMSFEVFKFLDPESISITLTASDAHRLGVVQNNQPRRITPRECARLQGFPDSFAPHPDDRHAYAQFGNSVAVPVVEHVLTEFLKSNTVCG